MDSSKALELDDIPKTLLVVGGGYVGLEMGMIYASLGSKVTLVERAEQLLPGTDADLVKPLAQHVQELFAGIYLHTVVKTLEEKNK